MLLDLLPDLIQNNLAVIGLLIVGFFVEKHYVSRLSVFSNSIALNIYVSRIPSPLDTLLLYADIGLVLGVVGLIAYLLNEEMGEYYYVPTYFAYSSLAVGMVLLLPNSTFWTLLALGIAAAGNFYLLDLFEEVAAPIA